MQYPAFVARFPEHSEIGRDITDDRVAVYRDNGHEVGVWRVNRRTTLGTGEVLELWPMR